MVQLAGEKILRNIYANNVVLYIVESHSALTGCREQLIFNACCEEEIFTVHYIKL